MEDLKKLGNECFSKNLLEQADKYYSAALMEVLKNPQSLPNDYATLHGNRSATLLKLNRPSAALEEAESAIARNPYWPKGHFRKGEALKALCRWKEAAASFSEAFRLSPTEQSLKAQINICQNKAKQEDEKPALQRLQEHVKATGTIRGVPVTPSFSQFSIEDDLGEGNYSQVFKAKFIPTNEVFALKVIDKKKAERLSLRHGNLQSELRAERRILSKLHHVNIVKLFHTFQDASNIYYVEEFCSGRELWFQLRVNPPLCLNKEWPQDSKLWGLCGLRACDAKFYLAQILNALVYLQTQGIVHRDLKPENVMICQSPLGPRNARVKLIDFGTARDLFDVDDDKVADEDKKGDDDRSLKNGRKRTHFIGTSEFMSPEAIHGRPADYRSDLWSYGCTAFQLFTGRTPFKGASDYLTFLKADAANYTLPSHLSNGSSEQKLLQRVLQVDPNQRASLAEDLKSCEYFEDIDFKRLEDPDTFPKLPIPSLLELCVERIGEAIWIETEAWGEGPLSRKSNDHKPTRLSKRRRFDGDDQRQKIGFETLHAILTARVKSLIRAYLEQRSALSSSTAIQILYGSNIREAPRIVDHTFLGFSQQEEGAYYEPYIVGLINMPSSNDGEAILEKLNNSNPFPRIMFVASSDKNISKSLSSIRLDIPIAPVPLEEPLDCSYYSFWIGGVLFIVLDAHRFDDIQAQWLERELLVGKLCARYSVVLSSKKFFDKSYDSMDKAVQEEQSDKDGYIDGKYRSRFIKEMQESGTQLILIVGNASNSKYTIPKTTPNEPNLIQLNTMAFPEKVRIIRLLPTDAISDSYSASDLTGYFYLEKAELPEDDGRTGGIQFGDSSDDD